MCQAVHAKLWTLRGPVMTTIWKTNCLGRDQAPLCERGVNSEGLVAHHCQTFFCAYTQQEGGTSL